RQAGPRPAAARAHRPLRRARSPPSVRPRGRRLPREAVLLLRVARPDARAAAAVPPPARRWAAPGRAARGRCGRAPRMAPRRGGLVPGAVRGGWMAASAAALAALIVRRSLDVRMEAVARACHELRGPLAAAQLGLELGVRVGELSPAQLRALDLELGRASLAL